MTHEQTVSTSLKRLHPLLIEKGENAFVWDNTGKRYIDFVGGIGVLSVGHRHPKVIKAAKSQLDQLTHSCFNALPHQGYLNVTDWLANNLPITGPLTSMLTNSGAESMENALKVARAYTGRTGVIAFDGGFHGRTLATLALTGKVAPYKNKLGPLPGPVHHVPFASINNDIMVEDTLKAIHRLFKVTISSEDIAAIVLEPVQGEGGFLMADPEMVQGLRKICDDFGIVLIADEIQSGFARSGKLFAMEHMGCEADIIVMGKAIGGGFPLGALTGRAEMMNTLAPGGLGGTYSGNPVACAAASAVFDIIDHEDLIGCANRLGAHIKDKIDQLCETKAGLHIGSVRGVGAMRAIEIVNPDGSAAADKLAKILTHCRENGLLLMPSGENGNVIRFLPPLTIELENVDRAFTLIEDALSAL
ncbi:MAG: aspartate aminotransferase family protein [Methylocystaceae bacterium]|nr:aspartate aminotransferase family protein [Methylocystaceae bacterium]